MSYDAIVIGAGHHGLVCAAFLAQSGWRVLVLERQSEVGGALRTAEVTLPGFSHDLCATNVSGFANSLAYHSFKPEFDELGLKFLTNKYSFATAYDEGQVQRVYNDAELTERDVISRSNEDLACWQDLTSFYRRTAPLFLPLYFHPMPSIGMAKQIGRLAMHPMDASRLFGMLTQSSQQFVERCFSSPNIHGLFFPWALHADFGPKVCGGALYAFVSVMSAYIGGLAMVAGGAGRLSQTLQTIIERRNGTVLSNTEVRRIQVRRGRAVAVAAAGGATFAARRGIVANVNPRILFSRLVAEDDVPSRFLTRIKRFRAGPGTFVVHLALSRPLEWRGAGDLSEFNYIHVGGTFRECDEAYGQALAGYIPARPMLVVSQTTQLDPSRAPTGCHVARIHARAFPSQILGDAAGTIKCTDWDQAREAVSDRLVDRLAEQAPNLKNALLARHSVTPLDLERDNPNLMGGDCVSGSHHLDQQYVFRPLLGWSRYQTPIRGLYLTGASTWPGGGIHGASGYLAAQQVLKHNRD